MKLNLNFDVSENFPAYLFWYSFLPVIEVETKSEFIAEKPLPTETDRILFIDNDLQIRIITG